MGERKDLLMQNRSVCAVICDVDGTLVDSERIVEQALRESATIVAGVPPTPEQFFAGRLAGLQESEDRLFFTFCKEVGIPVERAPDVEAAYRERRDYWLEQGLDALPGAERLVSYLVTHQIPTAIATNTTSKTLRLKAKRVRSNIFAYIPHVFTLDEVGGHGFGKPQPYLFQAAARAMNVDVSMCLVFEDSPKGIQAARAAGMAVVALTSTVSREYLPDADAYISNLLEFDPRPWGLPLF